MGWSLPTIIIAYWLENLVIGFFNVLKIQASQGIPGFFISVFFLIHFGLFTLFQGIFLLAFLAGGGHTQDLDGYAIALIGLALFISHGVSHYTNFILRGEAENTNVLTLMFAPYPRIFFMQIVIVFFGGFFLMQTGGVGYAMIGVGILVLKTLVDLISHLYQHRRVGASYQTFNTNQHMNIPKFSQLTNLFGHKDNLFKETPQTGTTITKTFTKPDGTVVTVTNTTSTSENLDGNQFTPDMQAILDNLQTELKNAPQEVTEEITTNPDGSTSRKMTQKKEITRSFSNTEKRSF